MAAPTAEEQFLLELVNEARLDPKASVARLISSFSPLKSPDADIQQNLDWFKVNAADLKAGLDALTPVQPLAWNSNLSNAALAHNGVMIAHNKVDHELPGEQTIPARFAAAGYHGNWQAENIIGQANSALHAHGFFMIDWGERHGVDTKPGNGLQDPAGHRNTIMDGNLREIGIGITRENNPATDKVGPLVVTQDFGTRDGSGAFILGVAYNDTNGNNFYTPGEGLGSLVVKIGGTQVTSAASGGYTLNTTATGAQTVTFTGAGLASAVDAAVTLTATSNIKLDIVNGNTLKTSASVSVAGPITNLVGLGTQGLNLAATSGNAHTITGTVGGDTFTGGAGIDTYRGLAGNDIYNIGSGDKVVEAAGGGTDRVQSATVSLNLANYANVENALLLGAANLNLTGNAGDNVLTGNSGNNTIDGGAGSDTMAGGLGNDIYVISRTTDKVIEAAGAGTDRVQSSLISLKLADYANVENALLSGSKNLNLTGNAGDNVLTGNSGNNILNGGAGSDTMTGGLGNDTYVISRSTDKVIEASGGGTDTVQSSLISLKLASYANVENGTLSGSSNLKLTGHSGNNVLTGNSGNNVIDGAGGNDTITGGLGNDTLTGGAGKDVFLFKTALNANTNVDRITDFNVADDTIRLENAIFAKLEATGALNAAFFKVGSAATDANDHIIYNKATGALIYDDNGSAAGGATQFATLAPNLSLTAADFFVI